MLTKQQLQRIAQRRAIGLHALERDYVQYLVLSIMYNHSQSFIFKGGTALRVVHHSPRYSEDLDFNATGDVDATKWELHEAVSGLGRYGIVAAMRNEYESSSNYSFDLGFQGPLYDGRDRSKSSVRIDMNLRKEIPKGEIAEGVEVAAERRLVSSEYDDVMPFLVTVLTAEHILAEKTRALLIRGKARDLYDLWFLIERGVQVDLTIINAKLALYQTTFAMDVFKQKVDDLEATWESDLRPLLGQMPEFGMVRERAIAAFAAVR
jgi:predicted nucleotidyltransferase component of viral defense system